jgi:hypothetical protein
MTESEQEDMEIIIERNTILQQQYKDVNEFKIKLLEENAQLKELLKECREYVAEWFADRTDVPFRQDKPRECVKKIDQVLGDKING